MHILFICPDKTDPTAFYRASGVTHDIEKKTGYQISTINWQDAVIQWQLLSNFDLVMLQRPFTKLAADIITYVKNMNKPVWIDYDDNLFALNPENKAFQTYNNPETQENIKNCLKNADVVTVPTEYLKQCYIQYNKNIEVIPNAFNDDIFKRGDLKPRAKKILWRGPEAHIYDMMRYGKELNRCTEEYPDWEFIFMGFYPWFLSETKNKGFLPGLDVIMYFHKLTELAPTAGYILLHDNLFNRCRSNVGWLEMSWAGAVCIVPEWWNVPGSLSYNSPETFYEAMRSVLAGEVDVQRLNMEAWAYIMEYLRLSKVNVKRIELINSLV